MKQKLTLKKETIADLTREELKQIKAGYEPCWVNLYTLYYCEFFCTTGTSKWPWFPTDE